MAPWFARLIATYPKSIAVAQAAATLLLSLGINRDMRPVLENNLSSSDPHVREHNAARAVFRDADTAAIVIVCSDPNGVFDPPCLSTVRSVAKIVEASPVVSPGAEVFSLTDYAYIEAAHDGTIRVGDLVQKLPSSEAEIQSLRRKVMTDHLLAGRLVSDDAEAALIVFRLSDSAQQNDVYSLLVEARDEALRSNQKVGVFSNDFQNREFELAAASEFSALGALAFAAILAFMSTALGWRGALATLATISLALAWGLGILGWLGYRQNVLTSSLPVVLVAIVSSPCFHVLETLRTHQNSPRQAADALFVRTVPSVVASGLTSTFGFLSLTAIPVYSLAEFGLFAAAGIASGTFASITFLPALVLGFSPRTITAPIPPLGSSLRNRIRRLIEYLGSAPNHRRYRRFAFAACGLIVFIALPGLSRVVVESEPAHFIPPGWVARAGFDLLDEKFGGTAMVSLAIDCGFAGGSRDPSCLSEADELRAYGESLEDVSFGVSLADRIKRLHRVMAGIVHDETIPRNAELIEQLLLFDDPDVVAEFEDGKRQFLLVRFFIYAYNSARISELRAKLESYLQRRGIRERSRLSGEFLLWARMIETIGENGVRSAFLLALFILCLCLFTFRKVAFAALSLVPVAIAAIVVFSLMGYFRIGIDIATVTLVTIVGAVTVDFYIHLIGALAHSNSSSDKCRVLEALRSTGTPIVFDCLSNLAFGALAISGFAPIRNLGLLLCIGMLVAVIVTLALVPSLLFTLGLASRESRGGAPGDISQGRSGA